MNRTFEELVNMPILTDGTEVDVRIGDNTMFNGKIVGLGTAGIIPMYVVECLDGTLPNDTYEYKFISLPLTEIFVK